MQTHSCHPAGFCPIVVSLQAENKHAVLLCNLMNTASVYVLILRAKRPLYEKEVPYTWIGH